MKRTYTPTIGLEVHAELKTQTKMFCASKNDSDETRPNVNVCPVCMAHPGTLPVINREAVRHVLRVGVALGSKLADYSEFDRKNYFYPDIPKGYQISQYAHPLVEGGVLAGVAITRVHLEEDTASSTHDDATGETHIDFNRAGVPLMELVTEPVIKSPEEAGRFARELQTLLRYLGACDANLEKGEMRVDANVSVSNSEELGVKVEIKNLNSFRSVERAVLYEIERQTRMLEKGEMVVQETRGWDDPSGKTFSQRTKEVAADYRYFPDPDLPSLKLSEIPELTKEVLEKEMPELPEARKSRYEALGLKKDDAAMFTIDTRFGDFFDSFSALVGEGKLLLLGANYLANDVANSIRGIETRDSISSAEISISSQDFAELIRMTDAGEISSRAAKDILAGMFNGEGAPRSIAESKGLFKKSSIADLGPVVDEVLLSNTAAVEEYKKGKANALQFLVGQSMRALRGSGDPEALKKLLEEKLRG